MQVERHVPHLVALVSDAEEAPEGVYRIGDLAKEFGVTLRTLRFYEDRNMLMPRRSGSTRLYSSEDRQRLKLILLVKRIGFSLSEIEDILKLNDQEMLSKEQLKKLIQRFKGQISVLNAQRKELDQALQELDETIEYLETKF